MVQSELYRVESKGADVADKFDFELNTSLALPEKPPAKASDKTKDGSKPGVKAGVPQTPAPANKANAAPPPDTATEHPAEEQRPTETPVAGGGS